MKRGRPVRSVISENIKQILLILGPTYGYDIYKEYKKRFGAVNLRIIYYHLKKGVEIGELKIEKIEKQQGEFTWGPFSERIYYQLNK